jgi:hypothetical protein
MRFLISVRGLIAGPRREALVVGIANRLSERTIELLDKMRSHVLVVFLREVHFDVLLFNPKGVWARLV